MACYRSSHSWRLSRSKLRKQRLVFLSRMRHDLEAHDVVPFAAILGADAAIASRSVGLEPDPVQVSGNRIDLAAEAWHPEAVDHIGAGDHELDFLAGWNVQHLLACDIG